MNLKITLGLVVIAVAIGVVTYANPFAGEEERVPRPPWFYQVSIDDINRIEVSSEGESVRFDETSEGTWAFDDPAGIPPSAQRWGGITLLVSGPATARDLTATNTFINDPAEFGLDNPHTIVKVGLTGDRQIEFRLGDKTTDGGQHYGEVVGFDELFLIAGQWGDVLARLAKEPPLPKWYVERTPEELEVVNIYSVFPGDKDTASLRFERKDDEWTVRDPTLHEEAVIRTAVVDASQTSTAPLSTAASENSEVFSEGGVTLTVKDHPDPVVAGDELTYTITVTNNRPDYVGFTVRNVLLRRVTFVSASEQSFNDKTGEWAVGGLESGQSATLQIVVRVDSSIAHGTVLSSTAVVDAKTPVDPGRLEKIRPLLPGPPAMTVGVPLVDDRDYAPWGITDDSRAIEIRFSGVSDRGTKYIEGFLIRIGSKAPGTSAYYAKNDSGRVREPVLLIDADWVEAMFGLLENIPYGPERSEPASKAN